MFTDNKKLVQNFDYTLKLMDYDTYRVEFQLTMSNININPLKNWIYNTYRLFSAMSTRKFIWINYKDKDNLIFIRTAYNMYVHDNELTMYFNILNPSYDIAYKVKEKYDKIMKIYENIINDDFAYEIELFDFDKNDYYGLPQRIVDLTII